MSLPMRNLSNFLQNCCHSLGEQLMSMIGRSRRGCRVVWTGGGGGAAGAGAWFARACVIMDPMAPSPDGQEKSQPSHWQVTKAMASRIDKRKLPSSMVAEAEVGEGWKRRLGGSERARGHSVRQQRRQRGGGGRRAGVVRRIRVVVRRRATQAADIHEERSSRCANDEYLFKQR